jgi:hypothetical protein
MKGEQIIEPTDSLRDAIHFADNAAGNALKQLPWEMYSASGHRVIG